MRISRKPLLSLWALGTDQTLNALRPLWSDGPLHARIALQSLWPCHPLWALRAFGSDLTWYSLRTRRTDWSFGSLNARVTLESLRAYGSDGTLRTFVAVECEVSHRRGRDRLARRERDECRRTGIEHIDLEPARFGRECARTEVEFRDEPPVYERQSKQLECRPDLHTQTGCVEQTELEVNIPHHRAIGIA